MKTAGKPDLFGTYLEQMFPGEKVVSELAFHSVRKWRFDYAFPEHMVAIEIDGGIFKEGRHNRPIGYIRDLEKLNTATSMGWRVLRIARQRMASPQTLEWITNTIELNKQIK